MNSYFNVTFVTKSGSTRVKRVWTYSEKTAETFIRHTQGDKIDPKYPIRVEPA